MQNLDVISIFCECTDSSPSKISSATPLADIPGWDSLALVSFMMGCQKKLKILAPSQQLSKCLTVGDLEGVVRTANKQP